MYTVAKVWNQSSENCLVGKYAFVLVSKNANKKDFYNIVKGIARSLITSMMLGNYLYWLIHIREDNEIFSYSKEINRRFYYHSIQKNDILRI